MIYGIGVDILRLERIEKIWKRHGQRLAEKILSPKELKDFAHSKNPVRFLTMAFAAKEACVKALGTGFEGVGYADAGTSRNAQGKPVLHFSARGKRLLRNRGIRGAHVSLSDEGGLVCAMVVMEKSPK